MSALESLKKEILEDSIIDNAEVIKIESIIFEDGKIDKEEADFLFELNDAVSGNDNDTSWKDLFVKAISSFVLDDDGSNGAIDADEEKYLFEKIQGDGTIDLIEKELLVHLKSRVGNLPKSLENLLN